MVFKYDRKTDLGDNRSNYGQLCTHDLSIRKGIVSLVVLLYGVKPFALLKA